MSWNNAGNPTSDLITNVNSISNGTPQFQFPQTAPATSSITYGGGSLEEANDPNWRDPQSAQWNLTVERQITPSTVARVSYVGMASYRLPFTIDLNQIPASTTPYNAPCGRVCRPSSALSKLASLDDLSERRRCQLPSDESGKSSINSLTAFRFKRDTPGRRISATRKAATPPSLSGRRAVRDRACQSLRPPRRSRQRGGDAAPAAAGDWHLSTALQEDRLALSQCCVGRLERQHDRDDSDGTVAHTDD